MPRISPRRISEPGSASRGFSLIEAIVALAITVLIATTAALLASSALDRERRARMDAETVRALQSLSARLADPAAPISDIIPLPDGWRAVSQPDPHQPDWQTWELFAPDSDLPRHILRTPQDKP